MGKMPVIGLVGACLASVLASGCGEWLTGGSKKDSPPPTFTTKPITNTQTPQGGWEGKPLNSTAGINGGASGMNTGMPTGNNMPSNTFSGGTPSAGGYNRMGNPSPDSGIPRSGSGISGGSGGISGGGDGRSSMNYPPTNRIDPSTYPDASNTSRVPSSLNDLGSTQPVRTTPTDTFPGAGRVPVPPLMTTPMGTHAAQTDDMFQKTSTTNPKSPDFPALPGTGTGTGSSISTPSNKLPAIPEAISTDPVKSPSTGLSLPTTTPGIPPLPGLPEPGASQPVPTLPNIPTPPQTMTRPGN